MLLAIDSGNTNVVFAVYDETDRMRGSWRASSDVHRTADEYAVWLTQLMALEGLGPADIDGAILANVVPAATYALKTLCVRYFKTRPLVIGEPDVELGLAVAIDRPEQVGEDRLVNAVAAHARYPGALVVVDFGTATTFDVIGAEGSYRGGVIAPGIHLSVEALYRAAAKLPNVGIRRPRSVIGRATVPAMESGIYWGYVGLIEGLIARIKAEYGEPMTVIATGGLAPVFSDAIEAIEQVDPDLTLRGLLTVYRANSGAG
ncbi:MAG TPA: type III pantothenate kinase [Kiloniellales bacterium]|nr:type III pantothenate kinase [Kiloniellales bacterium]